MGIQPIPLLRILFTNLYDLTMCRFHGISFDFASSAHFAEPLYYWVKRPTWRSIIRKLVTITTKKIDFIFNIQLCDHSVVWSWLHPSIRMNHNVELWHVLIVNIQNHPYLHIFTHWNDISNHSSIADVDKTGLVIWPWTTCKWCCLVGLFSAIHSI